MTTTFPFAEAIASSVRLVRIACPVTKELYGYAKPVVDMPATMRAFTEAYACQKHSVAMRSWGRHASILELDP